MVLINHLPLDDFPLIPYNYIPGIPRHDPGLARLKLVVGPSPRPRIWGPMG